MRTFGGILDIEVDAVGGISVPGNKTEEGEFTFEFGPVMAIFDITSRLRGKSDSITGARSVEISGVKCGGQSRV